MAEDLADNPLYPQIARASLRKLHGTMLAVMDEHFDDRDGSLLIVGPGSEVVPFSEHRERVAGWLKGGNILLLDYNERITADAPEYLKKKGFGQRFDFATQTERLDVRQHSGMIFTIHRDVRLPLPYVAGGISAIDMSVAVHHATPYIQDISAIFHECYHVLEVGGILHVGEGRVDMKRPERKIRELAEKLPGRLVVSDWRNPLNRRNFYRERPDDFNGELRELGRGDWARDSEIHITPEGKIYIRTSEKCAKKLGLHTGTIEDGVLITPLIDPVDPRDREHIENVHAYYDAAHASCEGLPEDVQEKLAAAVAKERRDAERGLVEHYSAPEVVRAAMEDAGFAIEMFKETSHGPFYNLVGRKL